MKKALLLAGCLALTCAGRAHAQVATITITIAAGSSLAFDVKGATPPIAQAEVWKWVIDGVPMTTPATVTCAAPAVGSTGLNPSTDSTCVVPPPAIPPGIQHRVAISAALADGTALGISNTLTAVMQLIIINLRVQ